MNRHLSKYDTDANSHTRRCCGPLITKEVQIQTSRRHHLTPVRMVTVQQPPQKAGVGKNVEKLGRLSTAGGMEKKGAASVEHGVGVPQNMISMELASDPPILLLGIYPKEVSGVLERYLHTHVHSSPQVEATQCLYRQTKQNAVHPCNRTGLSPKELGNPETGHGTDGL